MNNKASFLNNIKVESDKEKERILELQRRFDNGEIKESEISDEDMYALIKLYEEQTNEIKDDTVIIKNRMKKKLNELKKA